MTYLFLLSQEHPDLPRAEAEAVLAAEEIEHSISAQQENLLFVEADTLAAEQVERLAMTFEVAELLHTFPPDQYQKLATKNISTDTSFAVRKEYVDDTDAPAELEQNIGRIIDKNSSGSVDLEQPETLYRVYLCDGEAHLCRLVATIDRSGFEERQNQYRPFRSPVSLHPRLARTLVNLSQMPRDGTLLDPFCGTGGILIEAGLIGCTAYGLDVQQEMVDGSMDNLEAFNVDADVRQGACSDVETVFKDVLPVDAVVTDLPYGKASKVEDDPTETFLEQANDLATGRVVFMTDQEDLNGREPSFELYVHRSLSRYIYIIE